MRISVIIPTRDGNPALRACLTALARGFPPHAETIVVSDGGRVDLASYLADFAGPLRLTCVQATKGGPAHARNRGLEVAVGSVVAFTDDDCRPLDGWLDTICRRVCDTPPAAAGGDTINGLPANPYSDAAQLILDLVARHEAATCGEVRFFPANNCAFPAGPLRRLGGFDESFRTSEDRDLLRRWRAAGFQLHHEPGARIAHDSASDLMGYIRKFYGYGRGAARFHATDSGRSYGDSWSFHRRLPTLLGPTFKARGIRRSLELTGLLGVWEVANLAGFVAERLLSPAREPRA